MLTTVVNINNSPHDIYCGRGSIFGNPFVLGRDGNRVEVIKKYKEWFYHTIKDPIFLKEVQKLKGKRLGCFCKPDKSCHCDVICEYLNNIIDENHPLGFLLGD